MINSILKQKAAKSIQLINTDISVLLSHSFELKQKQRYYKIIMNAMKLVADFHFPFSMKKNSTKKD